MPTVYQVLGLINGSPYEDCYPGAIFLATEGPVWGSDYNEFPFSSTQRTQTQDSRRVHEKRKMGGIVSHMWGTKSLGDRQRGATIFVELIAGDKETNTLLEASFSVFLSATRLEGPASWAHTGRARAAWHAWKHILSQSLGVLAEQSLWQVQG